MSHSLSLWQSAGRFPIAGLEKLEDRVEWTWKNGMKKTCCLRALVLGSTLNVFRSGGFLV